MGQGRRLLHLADGTTQVHLAMQRDPDAQRWTPTFTGLQPDGVALWGVKKAQVTQAQAVAAVAAELSLPATTTADHAALARCADPLNAGHLARQVSTAAVGEAVEEVPETVRGRGVR